MESGRVKIWHSIVTRFGLFFMGLLILAIFVSGFLIYKRASTIISAFGQERIAHSSTLAEQAFYSLLSEVENDISILAENIKIQAFANDPTSELQNEITQLFHTTLKNKPNYFQIRLISLSDADAGQEIIRLDKKNSKITQTLEDKLQNKKNRPYFKAASNLGPSAFYFSSISLNEEYGVVSPSLTPTIRAISLIFNSNQEPTHMVIINLDLNNFYQKLRSIMTSGIELMLIDEDGQYLFASDMTRCFSKQLRSYDRFDADFVVPFSSLHTDSTQFRSLVSKKGNSFLSQIQPITYSSNDRKIYLLSFLKENIALSSVLYIKKYSYQIIPLVSLAALLVALVFIRLLAVRIGSITQAIGNYEQHSAPTIKLSENRKDELGVLARTFIKMKTKINQQVSDLKSALDKEQKAIKEKDEFLQNMSHELRTPLNSIMGLTQLLRKNKPTPDQEPIVDAIHRSTQSLAGLMHDVLDHQKLIEGQVQLKYKSENIAELLSDIHASYRFDAINKGLGFELKIAPELKEQWHQTDALRFTQIITNLIVNAIKFTDKGKITVEAKVINHKLVISVTDSGRGILPDNVMRIRERFYQEQNYSSEEGFGLGLSIVKQLLELFDGHLEISSEKDVGSTFTINLPLMVAEHMPKVSALNARRLALSDFSEKKNVLHIEDDESARLLVSQLFQAPQIELIQTNNLAFAKQTLSKQNPDLIISDLMLEHIDIGNELIKINASFSHSIIVLSALENERMKEISEFYLQKPFDVDHLLDLVICLLGKNTFDLPQLSKSYSQYDHDKVKIKKFIALLISEFETYLDRIDQAFENQDESEWNAIRHKLITHIRSLELHKLEKALPLRMSALNKTNLGEVKTLILYNLSYFRNELRLL
ncbi:ATP-binding protein [Reichenbachiella sp.]|uniref:ATP-binding protein n=1 Tax=Reichenbachiella sp. TaxID=2184521 RepID=UPI003B5B6BE0